MNARAPANLLFVQNLASQSDELQPASTPKQRAPAYLGPQTQVSGRTGEMGDAGERDRLLSVSDVAQRLNVSKDWVWDHSSRKAPLLPVIRMGDGTLRYRASRIEEFITERERLSAMRRKRR